MARVKSQVAHLKELTSDNREQASRVSVFERKVDLKLKNLSESVALAKSGDLGKALEIVRTNHGKGVMDDVRNEVAAMIRQEDMLLQKRTAESDKSIRITLLSIVIPAFLGVVLVGTAFYLSQQNITQRERAAQVLAEQRERLRVTLASIGDAIITTDIEGRITYLNVIAESVTGWGQDDAVGQPLESVFCIVNEETRQTVENPAKRALREGIIMGLANHTVLTRKDGADRPIDDSAAPIRDGQGRVVGCVLIFRDITERRRAERQLWESRELLRITLASIGDAVITTDAQGRITHLNTVAEAVTGWTHSEAEGQPLEAVFHIINEQTRKTVANPAARALREGVIVGLANHTVLITKAGTERPIDDSAAPIRDGEGRIVGCVLVFRDITERKLAEQARQRLLESERAARTEAERASRVKEEFFATLSHELRTPLNAILGWSRLIAKDASDPKTVNEGIQVITRNAKVQADLIADLLDMSRIISGKLRLEVEDVNLSDVVAAGIDAIRHSAEAKGIQIQSVLNPMRDTVRGDASRLQQVVWNVLSNAVKFTPDGGRVQIVLAKKDSHAAIVVSDTGVGIKPEFLPHLFERFRQDDASAARQHGGLGLGLAIVKHVVEQHGGSVQAESPGEGEGATFTVELPLAVMPAPLEDKERERQPRRAQPRPVVGDDVDLTGVKVLAVDDQADTRHLLTRILEERHAQVIVASSADEGLQALCAHRPHLVLCDIGMPGKDGYEFIKEMRGQGDNTPALAVTAFARTEDRSRALRAGYQGYITKPVEPSELVAAVAASVSAGTAELGGPSR
jgi:PAS domain S-box-containing protein